MSISNNTNKLQSLLDKINALPEAENLDEEISTQETLISEQDAKIAELAEILSNKAGGSGGGDGFENNTDICDIQITSDYFIDGIGYYGVLKNGTQCHLASSPSSKSTSIKAVCGSVVYIAQLGFYSATVSSGEILHSEGTGFTYRVPSTPTSVTINIITE